MPGKFELYRDARERYRFRLVSESGELVLSGDGYTQKVSALDAIVSIMRSAAEAAVVDMSLPGQGEIPIEDERMEGDSDSSYPDAGTGKRKKRRKKGKKSKKGKKWRKWRKH